MNHDDDLNATQWAIAEASFVNKKDLSADAKRSEYSSCMQRAQFEESGRNSERPPNLSSTGQANSAQSLRESEVEEFASVVKIFVDSVRADFVSPWQMMAPEEKSG